MTDATVRSCIENAQRALWSAPDEAAGELHHALNLLDGSREITDKATEISTDPDDGRITVIRVTNHKARAVLDD